MIIEQPAIFLRWLYPQALWRMDRKERAVYLTFDDGPIPEVTPDVLEILDRYNVKATFFMVGDNVARHPELLDEVRRRGHAVGNHTMNHIQGIKCTWRTYARNIADADELIGSRLFRPPHGLMKRIQMRTVNQRYNVVMYDVITRDYNSKLTPERVLDNVKRYARDGSIIVFHDSLKARDRMLPVLPQAIEWLLANGFTLLPLGQ